MYEPGMFWAVFGAAWIFGCATVAIIVWNLRTKRDAERERLIHEERMAAIEKGVPLPEFPDFGKESGLRELDGLFPGHLPRPRRPQALGILLVFASVGFMFAMLISTDTGLNSLWPMGLIGVFLGFGFLLYYRLTHTDEED